MRSSISIILVIVYFGYSYCYYQLYNFGISIRASIELERKALDLFDLFPTLLAQGVLGPGLFTGGWGPRSEMFVAL
jgi:hypothetical protein